MTWNPIWDTVHKKKEWGRYPPEELIRFVATNYYHFENRNELKFLDLGCGYGSASWYLAREGFDVTAIDGSKIILEKLRDRLKKDKLKVDMISGDLIKLPIADSYFDCVIDLYALMCNSFNDSVKIVKEVYRVLKNGGKFLSLTPCTEKSLSGQSAFSQMGVARFTMRNQIKELYKPFKIITTDYLERSQNGGKDIRKFWIISCTK